MSFTSDYILEQYRILNEIDWSDKDVCPRCSMMFDEISYCSDKLCPLNDQKDVPLENKEE
jgi:hypothetical protein